MKGSKQSSGFFSKIAPLVLGAGAFVAGWFAKEYLSSQEENDSESLYSEPEPLPPESKDWEFEGFTCPITQSKSSELIVAIMQDPVVTRYGHSFERKAIEDWVSRYQRCPLCNKALAIDDLKPNFQLRHAIQEWVRFKKAELQKSAAASELEVSKGPEN